MITAPVTVNELNGVVPPIAPFIVTFPLVPPVRVNDLDPLPLIVLENEIPAPAAVPPPFVESTKMFAFNVTGPVRETRPPLVVKLPPRLITVVPL